MIDFAPLLKIAPLFVISLMSPGPDFMLVSSLTMSKGRAAGLRASAGISVGVLISAFLCLFGLGFVFSQISWLMLSIKIMGGLYLIYLGFSLWKASLHSEKLPKMDKKRAGKGKYPFISGFFTNLTNPKALVFFTSIFALILTKDVNFQSQSIVVFFMSAASFVWFSFVSFGLSTVPMRKVYMRLSKWIDRIAGTFLTLFGLRLILSGRD